MKLGGERAATVRRWPLLAPVVLALCLAMLAAGTASAARPAPPIGFRVEASNGYTVHGIVLDGAEQEDPRDELLLFVVGPSSAVIYATPAEVANGETEPAVKADLGALGSIDLRFVPSGKAKTEPSACDPKPQRLDSGFYEGTISLRGEEGYMQVNATRAPGEVRVIESFGCPTLKFGSRGHLGGGELTAKRRSGATVTEFSFFKGTPRSAASFDASIEERRGPMIILRAIEGRVPAGDFKYDVKRQRATLRPGAPFSGSATFNGSAPRGKRIHGSLSVDFPGHSDVRLTPRGTKAALVRATENTPNPSRLPRLAALSTFP
ncbi:MAG TPA: hypothetical protein VFX45_11540 [Solirubrobacterales bacterium]|nr:hypothetical protein [Solirubrobacterales bacterium]